MTTAKTEDLIEKLVYGSPEESAAARLFLINQGSRVLPTLLNVLGKANERECWAILSILAGFGDQQAVPHVIQCLYAEHPAVRGIAAQCLGDLGDARAVAPMLNLLKRNPESITTIWFVQALGKIGNSAAVDTLIDIVTTTRSAAVRFTAIEALGLIGDPRAIPIIIKYTSDKNLHIRSRAVAAIEALRSHQTVPKQA